MTPENSRVARLRDWGLLALSSACLSLAIGLVALRIPFRNLIDRSLIESGWPSSLTLIAVLSATSVLLGVAYGLLAPPPVPRSDDGEV